MKVNLYDFDGTIYNGDSSIDFYIFCLKRKFLIIKFLPKFILYLILNKLKLKTKEQLKEIFFAFVTCFDDIDGLVKSFWEDNLKKIKLYYMEKRNENDIIISASPYFLLEYICKYLKVKDLIASDVNKLTGKYEGKNCSGSEKVKKFTEKYKEVVVENAYGNSKNDIPMLELANFGYMVKGNKIKIYSK